MRFEQRLARNDEGFLGVFRMAREFWHKHRSAIVGGSVSTAALGWCALVDLQMSLGDVCRVLGGLLALWLPLGGAAWWLLRDRCSDRLTQFTLSAVVAYALTPPLYMLFGVCNLYCPGAQHLFYVLQGVLLLGWLAAAWRSGSLRQLTHVRSGWQQWDWTLIALVACSLLVTPRYKDVYQPLPGNAVRVIGHGDATYLTSLAYELGRETPAVQQSVRSGLKERAYHMYPHLTAMLVARFTGQDDIYLALAHYNFTIVEVLLCLIFFCLVRRVTGSRTAGHLAVALLYILAIPLPPVGPFVMSYLFFNWYPYATSSVEPSMICSPQTYLALPVMFGALLFVLQLSLQISRRQTAGTLAMLAALTVAVLLRFRLQAFIVFFPGMLLLLGIAVLRTRKWQYAAAGLAGLLVAAVQALEMKLPLYYPDSTSILVQNNFLARDCVFMNAWPGAYSLRAALDYVLYRPVFEWVWQVVGLSLFCVMNMAGIPVTAAALLHVCSGRTWRSDTWAFSAMIVWLIVTTIAAATCLSTPFDSYSIGGQSLFLVGWYALPLLAIGLYQFVALLPAWAVACRPYAAVAAVLLLAGACLWQRVRPNSELQKCIAGGVPIDAEEWAAIGHLRRHLPAEAILLTRAPHLPPGAAILSGLVGRTMFLEYSSMGGPLGGGPQDQWKGRIERIDRVWEADDAGDFLEAVLDTGATHLIEYADHPMQLHPGDCLQEFWRSPQGTIRVWAFQGSDADRVAAREARRDFDPAGEPFRTSVAYLPRRAKNSPAALAARAAIPSGTGKHVDGSPAVLATGSAAAR